jgi:hypothetical protein
VQPQRKGISPAVKKNVLIGIFKICSNEILEKQNTEHDMNLAFQALSGSLRQLKISPFTCWVSAISYTANRSVSFDTDKF